MVISILLLLASLFWERYLVHTDHKILPLHATLIQDHRSLPVRGQHLCIYLRVDLRGQYLLSELQRAGRSGYRGPPNMADIPLRLLRWQLGAKEPGKIGGPREARRTQSVFGSVQ